MASQTRALVSFGAVFLAIAAAAGLGLSVFAYFERTAIAGTAGLLAVVGASAAITVAALIVSWPARTPAWLHAVLDVLLLIGILATGIAAWFLELPLLMAFMGAGLFGWFLHVLFGPPSWSRAAPARGRLA